MEVSEKTEEFRKNDTVMESFVTLSNDKKWFIHKTVITHIKPVKYVEKVMGIGIEIPNIPVTEEKV